MNKPKWISIDNHKPKDNVVVEIMFTTGGVSKAYHIEYVTELIQDAWYDENGIYIDKKLIQLWRTKS